MRWEVVEDERGGQKPSSKPSSTGEAVVGGKAVAAADNAIVVAGRLETREDAVVR